MNVGDLVWAKHPRMYNAYTPGLIVKKQPMFKVGHRYQVMFPGVGLRWINFSNNLMPLEEGWVIN